MLKVLVLVPRVHKHWLDQEENANRWYGSKAEPFGTMERRIFTTY